MFSIIIYILIAAVGFMMAFLYKKSITSAQFFNPDPKRSLKIYLWVFVLSLICIFVFSYFELNVLAKSQIPEDAKLKYLNIRQLMYFFLNLFFFSLIVVANVYSLSLKKIAFVPYLLAFAFYALFILNDTFRIADYYSLWQKTVLNVTDENNYHNIGLMKLLLGFIVSAFNAAAIWWSLRK